MKKSLKKILALALTGSMTLGMLSITSLAEDNTDSVILDSAEVVVNPDLAAEPEPLPEKEELPATLEDSFEVGETGEEVSDADGEAGNAGEKKEPVTLPEVVEREEAAFSLRAENETQRSSGHPLIVTIYKVLNGAIVAQKDITTECKGNEGWHYFFRSDIHPAQGDIGWGTEDWIGWGWELEEANHPSPPFTIREGQSKQVTVNAESEDGETYHATDSFYLFYKDDTVPPTYNFKVVYSAGLNGAFADGEQTMTVSSGETTETSWTTTVTSEVPHWDCHRFVGWTRNMNGDPVSVAAGSEITVTTEYQENTIYITAHWEEAHQFSEEYASDAHRHWHVCETCGVTEAGSTEDHAYTRVLSSTAATCTENRVDTVACVCGAQTTVTVPETALGHSFSETVYGHDEQSHWQVCERSGCGARNNEGEHDWGEGVISQAPTCEAEGIRIHTCTVCEGTKTEPVPASGHVWSSELSHDENSHWYACTNEGCDARKGEGEHRWEVVGITTAATCERDGVRLHTCRDCGENREETIPSFGGHAMGDWEVTREATANTAGERTRSCTRPGCGHTETEAIPATGGSGGSSGGGSGSGGSSGGESSSGGGGTTTPSQPEENLPEEDLGEEDVPLAELPFPFEDVSEKDWFYNSVKYVYGKGLMTSVLKSRWLFGPGTDTSRNTVVTVLYRLDSADEFSELKVPLAGEPIQFSDQAAIPAWANEAVAWAITNGVVNGYRDGSFGGQRNVTRQELAVMLYRYASSKGYDVSARADLSVFEDADSVAKYAREAMSWAVGAGIIKGMSDTWLNPTGTATRAHVAATLERFCEMMEAGKGQA